MGSRLVAQVLARWPHLSDPAFRVLVRMALVALDDPRDGREAGVYFGGWELLAMTLRQGLPDGDDDAAIRRRNSARVQVRRAIAELVDAGAIERTIATPRTGSRQVYRFVAWENSPLPHEGELSVTPEGERRVTPEGELSVALRENSPLPPRNHKEPRKELRKEPAADSRTGVSDRARDLDDVDTAAAALVGAGLTSKCPHGRPVAADGSTACPRCDPDADWQAA